MVWVLVGERGCVAVDAGHGLVTLLSLSQIYYPEHILVYGRLEDLLLSSRGFWLFLDRLSGFLFGGGGPCTALSLGLRGGGLES